MTSNNVVQLLKLGSNEDLEFQVPADNAQYFTTVATKPTTAPKTIISESTFRTKLRNFFFNGDDDDNSAAEHDDYDFSSVAVVVADKTRLCEYDRYLPVLIDFLVNDMIGVDDHQDNHLTVYIAYGTHPRQSDEESFRAYGPIYENEKVKFVHHDCNGENTSFKDLGETTGRGTPVRFRKDILVESTFIVTFGAISHHYFAGYGGGRKLIFPGLGERNAIYHNHGLFLDREKHCLQVNCQPGRIEGNPLAEDLAEVERHCVANMAIHGIMDSTGKVCDLIVTKGGSEEFAKACAVHALNCEVNDKDSYFDLVLASCGGYPKDINFVQCHKAIHHAAAFVRNGGTLLLLAECRDGIGSQTFMKWFEDYESTQDAFDALAKNYEGNGGTAMSLMEKTQRIRIKLVNTALDKTLCDSIGVDSISQKEAQSIIDDAVTTAADKEGSSSSPSSIGVIPNASLTVRVG